MNEVFLSAKEIWEIINISQRRFHENGTEILEKPMKIKMNRHVQSEQTLRRELEQYRRNGCMICLNGRPSSPEKIISACLRENGSYMRDFVSDETQRVKKIDFIKIKERE